MKTRYTPEQLDNLKKAKKQYDSQEQEFLKDNQYIRPLKAAELVSKQRAKNKNEIKKDTSNYLGH